MDIEITVKIGHVEREEVNKVMVRRFIPSTHRTRTLNFTAEEACNARQVSNTLHQTLDQLLEKSFMRKKS